MSLAQFAFDRQPTRSVRSDPIVFVIDDDVSVRESLKLLIDSAGWRAETCASAAAFLSKPRVAVPSCVILDMSLPDLDGLEVQRRIADERPDLPIIFITGHGDIPMSVRAMKAGAVEFLTKPFGDTVVLSAIDGALEQSAATFDRDSELRELRERHKSLSRREQEVMRHVVAGRLNKQIAAELHISEITVKAHRGKVMRKMEAGSLAELVMMAGRLGVTRGESD